MLQIKFNFQDFCLMWMDKFYTKEYLKMEKLMKKVNLIEVFIINSNFKEFYSIPINKSYTKVNSKQKNKMGEVSLLIIIWLMHINYNSFQGALYYLNG